MKHGELGRGREIRRWDLLVVWGGKPAFPPVLCCTQGFTVLLFGHWFNETRKNPVFTETASFSKPRRSAGAATAIPP